MRLTQLFLALAASAPFSLVQAQEAPQPNVPTQTAPLPEGLHKDGEEHDHSTKPKPDETLVDYFWRQSDVAFHDGDYPRAIGLHKAIVALDATETESYSVGAWLLWSLDKPAEAVEFLENGLKANPKDPEMWDAAAQHYDLQKKFADSQKMYAKAVELAGKDADLMMRRRYAHAAERNNDWAKSKEIWTALVADFPADQVNKNNLAKVDKHLEERQQGA